LSVINFKNSKIAILCDDGRGDSTLTDDDDDDDDDESVISN
jgi:hypothetical protein